jgi:hypothetical protein
LRDIGAAETVRESIRHAVDRRAPVETLAWLWQQRRSSEWPAILTRCALVAASGVVVALPALVPLIHYGGRVRGPLPFVWLDPAMAPGHLIDFVRANVTKYAYTGLALAGLVRLLQVHSSLSRRFVLVWCGSALALFAWAAYAWRILPADMAALAMAPAHHFLIYVRATECVLGGIAIAALASFAAERMTIAADWAAVCAAVVAAVHGRPGRTQDRCRRTLLFESVRGMAAAARGKRPDVEVVGGGELHRVRCRRQRV